MNICLDTGFLFALYEESKQPERHELAINFFNTYIDPKRALNKILLVWPILYETVNSRFAKFHFQKFDRDFTYLAKSKLLQFIDDTPYRIKCLNDMSMMKQQRRNLSLVDRVLRSVLEDTKHEIDALITFDPKDFYDICSQRKMRLLCQEQEQ